MKSKFRICCVASATAVYSSAIITMLGLSATGAFAAATANDTAANYTTSWGTSPPNNGSGFGPWNVTINNNGVCTIIRG